MKLTIKPLNISKAFPELFYTLVADGEPIGTPMTEKQAQWLLEWLTEVIQETIDD